MMMNWRTACVLLGLSSLLACAKATTDDLSGDSGGADSGGGAFSDGGAPAGGAPNAGTNSAGTNNGGAGAPVAGGSTGGAPGHAGAAGASTGGHSGTSSGGAAGAAGKGGGTSVGGAAGAGGGSGGATSTGPCANPIDIMGKKSGEVGLAGGCFRTMETFNSLGCSNFTGGRTIKVNGMLDPCAGAKTTFAPLIDGYNYFEVSAGDVAYASFFWYTS